MIARQEESDGAGFGCEESQLNLKMKYFFVCPKCHRRFDNGKSLGGHIAGHRRSERMEEERETVGRGSKQAAEQAALPAVQFNGYSNSTGASSSVADRNMNAEIVDDRFCRVLVRRRWGEGDGRDLQTKNLLSKMQVNFNDEDGSGDDRKELDLTLRL